MKVKVKQFNFNAITDTSVLFSLKEKWEESLTAPQDDYWEAMTENANHWELKEDKETIGYACVNENNLLLQFFVRPLWMSEGVSIFQQFIHQQKIKKALIGTNNPICLSIAMHCQQSIAIHVYLFTDFLEVEPMEKEETLRAAEVNDLERMVDFCHESMGGSKEWLSGYIGNLIARGEFFVLEEGTEILGICEVRKRDHNPTIADIGMVVAPLHRRKGLGTFLLGKAKEIAIQWDKKPICSCDRDNIGSLKSIQRNGFRSVHQMLLMEF